MKKITLMFIILIFMFSLAYAGEYTWGGTDSTNTLIVKTSPNVELGYIADTENTNDPYGNSYGIYGFNSQGSKAYAVTSNYTGMYVRDYTAGDNVTETSLTAIDNSTETWSKMGE
ncbi:MAG: hypothetical protein FXF49_04270 [Flexistipes sinusarabici]|uniref:Uncharacterized protein n=1 Tax=Flexistipes sinusarabici TaxID=2352 RepID=A0A5D0MQC2_FLESI|nr:hypothetical protein [Flexistipes sinusarabici]TYB33840.1 MAG: hypothetical protein FXF49_04270 [Flexistipes sinusarabici]